MLPTCLRSSFASYILQCLYVDIANAGTWSSPEVGGECPPPCVDFSFDSIDEGQRAVMFGGYRPESGASSGAYILDMETWVIVMLQYP